MHTTISQTSVLAAAARAVIVLMAADAKREVGAMRLIASSWTTNSIACAVKGGCICSMSGSVKLTVSNDRSARARGSP